VRYEWSWRLLRAGDEFWRLARLRATPIASATYLGAMKGLLIIVVVIIVVVVLARMLMRRR
jgi:hypothetical protein